MRWGSAFMKSRPASVLGSMALKMSCFSSRSASSSTRPASVLPNFASMIRSGSSGFRLTQNVEGSSASQVKNASEIRLPFSWPPHPAAYSSSTVLAENA